MLTRISLPNRPNPRPRKTARRQLPLPTRRPRPDMPRKKPPAAENHERWLVSYADFITLLFAFFVVMFASSQADKAKASQVSAAVREALEKGQFGGAVAGLLGRTVNAKPRPKDATP